MAALPWQEVMYAHLIETGTGHGEGIRRAKRWGFEMIQSIEYDPACYEEAVREFGDDPTVKLYHGSSPDVLREILRPDWYGLIWLDAHYSGDQHFGQTVDPVYGECPLLEELKVILSIEWVRPPRVVIDDAGLFLYRNFGWYEIKPRCLEQWPTAAHIEKLVSPLAVGYCAADDYLFLYEHEGWKAARDRVKGLRNAGG